MSVTRPQRTLEELDRLAHEVYNRHVLRMLRPEDDGKFIALDVETGDYEIDADDYAAVTRLEARNPKAEVWLMRAGHRATYKMRSQLMIPGTVNADYEGVVRLRVRGPTGAEWR